MEQPINIIEHEQVNIPKGNIIKDIDILLLRKEIVKEVLRINPKTEQVYLVTTAGQVSHIYVYVGILTKYPYTRLIIESTH